MVARSAARRTGPRSSSPIRGAEEDLAPGASFGPPLPGLRAGILGGGKGGREVPPSLVPPEGSTLRSLSSLQDTFAILAPKKTKGFAHARWLAVAPKPAGFTPRRPYDDGRLPLPICLCDDGRFDL